MNEIPTPQMYFQGKFWPDLYIANQLDAAVGSGGVCVFHDKHNWQDAMSLEMVSLAQHGKEFHDTFIEPMCRKIAGRSSSEISAKYHRAVWLPLYWPQTLRTRQSIPTPFWYPKAGYAGAILVDPATNGRSTEGGGTRTSSLATAELSATFLAAKPRHEFSVLFVVDESPIYRITDMDVCAGIECEWHRLVIEWSGPRRVLGQEDIAQFVSESRCLGHKQMAMPLPTIANVQAGWKPRPHMNDQLLKEMANELSGSR